MFWHDLSGRGDKVALIQPDGSAVSYADLAARADAAAEVARGALAGPIARPLVLVEMRTLAEPIIAYLAALRAGWPVIVLASGSIEKDSRIRDNFRPNLIYRETARGWGWETGDAAPAEMHDDLAIMLSTSGTTGAPKLVRSSGQNITANIEAVREYLELTPDDRTITTLQFHYSYGLSVLNTHLACGGAVILTENSVTDSGFWEAATRHHATSMSLVPFQFELLEQSGFADRVLPSLRYVTVSGAKMNEELLRRFLDIAANQGWRLFVMYGATEAGPRMAYVPPEDLAQYPESIGVPISGGRLSLRDAAGAEITGKGISGELVFEGPSVMLGYAETRDELDAPAGPSELRTGDIAERLENGFFRIVGRNSRFLKLFGLRVSLDEVERALSANGMTGYCTGNDSQLMVFLPGAPERGRVQDAQDFLIQKYGLTHRVVRVEPIDDVPLMSSGKVDYRRLAAMAEEIGGAKPEAEELEQVLRDALRTGDLDLNRSFSDLGGDSLSFLEVQMALSTRLGYVPENWERRPLRELFDMRKQPKSFWQPISIDVVGRVVAIFSIMALHSVKYPTMGGAYLLVLLIGYSMARFQRVKLEAGKVGPVLGTMLIPMLIGYYGIMIATHVLWTPVPLPWFILMGNFVREFDFGIEPYWFVSFYAQVMLLFCLPFLFKPVRQLVAHAPLAFGLGLVAAMSIAALLWGQDVPADYRIRVPLFGMQLILMGWCVFFAQTLVEKLVVTAVFVANLALFWLIAPSVVVMTGLGALGLLWIGSIRLPAMAVTGCMFIARMTLFLYLAHPLCIMVLSRLLGEDLPRPAMYLGTVALSIPVAYCGKAVFDWLERTLREGVIRAPRLTSGSRV